MYKTSFLFNLLIFVAFTLPSPFVTQIQAGNPSGHGAVEDPDSKFDRLDGTGKSGKKVNVIEWGGNLEIHVYPRGSLAGLGLKIDTSNGRKVMVISYRFVSAPNETLIRRAILGVPLSEGFKTYRDTTAEDYDKIIITNNTLAQDPGLVAFKPDAPPSRLYPVEVTDREIAQIKEAVKAQPKSENDSVTTGETGDTADGTGAASQFRGGTGTRPKRSRDEGSTGHFEW